MTAIEAAPTVARDPVCDFCCFYAFNGDEHGAYTDEGRCEHPAHPRPMDPGDFCADFICRFCPREGGEP
jgi:hypothetical protein